MVRPLLLIPLVLSLPLAARSFDFSDFSTLSGLQLAGSAQQFGTVLRLTDTNNLGNHGDLGNHEAGAAWTADTVDISGGFTTSFLFRLTDFGGWPLDWSMPSGRTGADGITFTIQGAGPDAVGLSDSGIGYMGIPDSLVVEVDTWANYPPLYCEPNDAHVSVHSLGTLPNRAEHCPVDVGGGEMRNPALATAVIPAEISTGGLHSAQITYRSGNLWVVIDGAPLISLSVDIPGLLELPNGRAFVGFTASTGGAYENQDILSWSFTEIPEPATVLLFGGALAGSGLLRRRRIG